MYRYGNNMTPCSGHAHSRANDLYHAPLKYCVSTAKIDNKMWQEKTNGPITSPKNIGSFLLFLKVDFLMWYSLEATKQVYL